MTVSLVLLPGLDGTGELFQPLLRELPNEVQPIVLSYPVHEHLDYPALKTLVLSALPTDRPFVLVGESFSGPVAVLAAAARPEGLLGLILCASYISAPRRWVKFAAPLTRLVPIHSAARIAGPRLLMGRFRDPEVTRLMFRALVRVSEGVLRSRLSVTAHVNVVAELRSVDVPSLYLLANEDSVVPRKAAKAYSRAANRGNVEVVAGPHFLLQCVPADAARPIVRFIEGLRSGA